MREQTSLKLSGAKSADKKIAARSVLAWYDRHARDLPWRIGPAARRAGVRPDPYKVWLSEIMLQQTTVATVGPRFAYFLERWPTVQAMGAAAREDILAAWAGLGYYARARNLHACAQVISTDHNAIFPDTEERLRALPGIGAYTAAAIMAIAFDKKAIVMDGNIERVTARLYAEQMPLPAAKPHLKILTADYWPSSRHGDFAQALMDIGAMICRPKRPLCGTCPLSRNCTAFANGDPERYPFRGEKKAKPTRYGSVFVIENNRGEIGFEQRPDKGLLGGMLGLPGTVWTEQLPDHVDDRDIWQRNLSVVAMPLGEISHTFTHFHLKLSVYGARPIAEDVSALSLIWMQPSQASLPTLMQKAIDCWATNRPAK